MRYRINFQIRQLLIKHHNTLKQTPIKHNLNNLIYKNKSISRSHLNLLLAVSKIPRQSLNPLENNFDPTNNLGEFSKPINIKFKKRDKNLAEFIGIMLGDGNIYNNSVRIIISNEEKDFREHIFKLFKKLFEIHPKLYQSKNSKSLCLYVYSKKLRMFLERHGLVIGNKVKNNISVPNWIKKNKLFSKHCVRGMIDTDGNVHYHKRDKQIYISFKNHAPNLLMDLQEMIKFFNIKFIRNNAYTVSLYRKEHVKRYINEIGFSNTKHIIKINNFFGAVV